MKPVQDFSVSKSGLDSVISKEVCIRRFLDVGGRCVKSKSGRWTTLTGTEGDSRATFRQLPGPFQKLFVVSQGCCQKLVQVKCTQTCTSP